MPVVSFTEDNMIKVSTLISNPNNPRIIRDEKFKKLVESIQSFPKMMELRPIIVDGENMVLGGNMRLKALTELGMTEIPDNWVKQAADLTPEQVKEFIVKDNVGFGEWDWDLLANEWDQDQLEEWGVDMLGIDVDSSSLGTDFSLENGEKSPFQQITFTLADEQAIEINNAIDGVKKTDEYKYMETAGNENSNGNAIALIVQQWAEQKK